MRKGKQIFPWLLFLLPAALTSDWDMPLTVSDPNLPLDPVWQQPLGSDRKWITAAAVVHREEEKERKKRSGIITKVKWGDARERQEGKRRIQRLCVKKTRKKGLVGAPPLLISSVRPNRAQCLPQAAKGLGGSLASQAPHNTAGSSSQQWETSWPCHWHC